MKKCKQDKKQIILDALAATMKELRGTQSQFMFCSENDISLSIVSTAERALKDPQLTTFFKLAEAYNITPVELIKKISLKLPKDFSLIEK